MDAFTTLTAIAAPLPLANVDTDKIIPARFLKTIKRTGLGVHLFDTLRYRADGSENPDFVLNNEPYRRAQILIAFENFGCGSSREHAPWAIEQWGIRALIGSSFADIFFNNCFKTGLLPIVLPEHEVARMFDEVAAFPGYALTVDLPRQRVVKPDGSELPFEITEFRKHCLVGGLDEIGLTLRKADKVRAFEAERIARMPWLAHRIL